MRESILTKMFRYGLECIHVPAAIPPGRDYISAQGPWVYLSHNKTRTMHDMEHFGSRLRRLLLESHVFEYKSYLLKSLLQHFLGEIDVEGQPEVHRSKAFCVVSCNSIPVNEVNLPYCSRCHRNCRQTRAVSQSGDLGFGDLARAFYEILVVACIKWWLKIKRRTSSRRLKSSSGSTAPPGQWT